MAHRYEQRWGICHTLHVPLMTQNCWADCQTLQTPKQTPASVPGAAFAGASLAGGAVMQHAVWFEHAQCFACTALIGTAMHTLYTVAGQGQLSV